MLLCRSCCWCLSSTTVLTASPLGTLAVLSLIAPTVVLAGYATYVGSRGALAAELRHQRLESDVRRRLEDISPRPKMSRSNFEDRLGREVRRSLRHGIPLCVLPLRFGSEKS
jgi:hypothetical protein